MVVQPYLGPEGTGVVAEVGVGGGRVAARVSHSTWPHNGRQHLYMHAVCCEHVCYHGGMFHISHALGMVHTCIRGGKITVVL